MCGCRMRGCVAVHADGPVQDEGHQNEELPLLSNQFLDLTQHGHSLTTEVHTAGSASWHCPRTRVRRGGD